MEQQIKEWALSKVSEAKARRDWSALPSQFEQEAVVRLYMEIKRHFGKQDVKARIKSSAAMTFDDLSDAINLA